VRRQFYCSRDCWLRTRTNRLRLLCERAAVNKKLSEDHADNVTNILLQKGDLPLTRMLAPGAMGEAYRAADPELTNILGSFQMN